MPWLSPICSRVLATLRLPVLPRCEQSQLFGWVEGGCGLHGAQAQYVRVPMADATLAAVPASVSDEEALLLGVRAAPGRG